MPSRSFSSPTGGEAVTFTLDGTEYHCIPQLPAGFSLDIMRFGNAKAAEFFDIVVIPEDVDAFATAIRDTEHVVPQSTLDELIRWLIEVYTGRPTGPSNGSSRGRPSTALPSTPLASGKE